MVKKEINENLSASLVLPKILPRCLGFDDTCKFIDFLKEKADFEYKFESDQSNFMKAILDYFGAINVPYPYNILDEAKLREYDLNIKDHIDKINGKREIVFKVFQYAALLITEIYLDLYFQKKEEQELGEFIEFLNQGKNNIPEKYTDIDDYLQDDLEKLCYWMATGSGKTLVMHINIHQYLHYAEKYRQEINNIILITPNEDLSRQHLKEFEKSGFRAIMAKKDNFVRKAIKIIDINKLSETTKDKTISYRAFGDKNLILVDEGHRGASGNAWLKMRSKVAKEGFTMEYSATFRDVGKKKEAKDYKKTILFDYSYKYYHKEGYGKDYFISNVGKQDEYEKNIMLGNLLSFYQQKKLFLENRREAETTHLIENPLWILVGSRVVESDKDNLDEKISSDIFKFVVFLNRLKLKKEHYLKAIENFLVSGNLPLKDERGNPLFQDHFPYLRELLQNTFKNDTKALFDDLFKTVFYSGYNDSLLVMEDIHDSDGEIGLKYGDSDATYFGLIYVGKGNDKKILKKAKETANKELNTVRQRTNSISKSQFKALSTPKEQPVNVLIGAKKFIEGWDNYRISSMLLMNFAKTRGVSAIQLFGRGVRIHGYKNSMKRSSKDLRPISGELKKYLPLLETLNVFGIDASYMEAFREELAEDIEFYVEKEINIHLRMPDSVKFSDLLCIERERDVEGSFRRTELVSMLPFATEIRLDLNPHITAMNSKTSDSKDIPKTRPESCPIFTEEYLDLVDWERLLTELRRHKRVKNYQNLSLCSAEELKNYLVSNDAMVSVYGDMAYLNARKDISVARTLLERAYLEVITKAMNKNYSLALRRYYEKRMSLAKLSESKVPTTCQMKIFTDEKGAIKGSVDERIRGVLEAVLKTKSRIIDFDDIQTVLEDTPGSKNALNKLCVRFDKHAYYPLLVAQEGGTASYTFHPAGLNDGEKSFIDALRIFLERKDIGGRKVVLLRNHEGIGYGYYLETELFYPDFILWILEDTKQKIIFIDPKGLNHVDWEKINFHKYVKAIERNLREKHPDEAFELYSFIVSQTPKEQLSQDILNDPESRGIYLTSDRDYLSRLFEKVGVS
jgi:hypothetical protein